jgi:hypothetical protein
MKINLADPTLFGNEVAEDENDEIFLSYAVDRHEITRFINDYEKIAIIRADKGQGKSALLKLLRLRIIEQDTKTILINTTAAAITPEIDSEDSDKWVQGWKKTIFHQAACTIGSKINLAFSDDAMSLVEEAEKNGFKSRSFFSSIVDRIKIKSSPIEHDRIGASSAEELLKRWNIKAGNIWFIIDDTDQNFVNTPRERVKVASLFTAIRQISNLVPEFKFRLAVRPYIWSIIKRKFESLSHNEQYMADIDWKREDFSTILSKRIQGYLERTDQWDQYIKKIRTTRVNVSNDLIQLVFEVPMPWGIDTTRNPSLVLWTLSRHRPRWLIELCRKAAAKSIQNSHSKIMFNDINSELYSFGKRRIEDTIAEYNVQCPNLEELLTAFSQEPERFKTEHLLKIIQNKVLSHMHLKIEGILGTPSAIEVAHFLFQIGFITARKDDDKQNYEHFSYEDKPSLLSSRANLDQGHTWEIHPVFRQILSLKNA